jgi:mono/diheme cytochrome c family protein
MKWKLALLALLSIACAPAWANPVKDGRALLETHCSRCHAIGMTDDSRHDEAPPFREVMKVYGARALEEALAEGLVTGHPDMPEFVFTAKQVGAIEAYLETLEASP